MNEALEWLQQSEYDLGTAQAMLDSARYPEELSKALKEYRPIDDDIGFLTRLSTAGVTGEVCIRRVYEPSRS